MTKNLNEVARFQYSARANAIIEILRLIGLFLVVTNHIAYVADLGDIDPFFSTLRKIGFSSGVIIFLIITSFYTVGKGKDYFLRSSSRLLFVMVLVMCFTLPLYLTGNFNMNTGYEDMGIHNVLMGGRMDIWYLYALIIAIFFMPLINISKFATRFPVISTILSFGVIVVFEFFVDIFFFNPFFNAAKFVLLGVAFHTIFENYNRWNSIYKRKLLFWIGIPLLLGDFMLIVVPNGFPRFYIIFNLILILIASQINIKTPKKLSWLVHHAYFVYEIHFFWQIVFVFISKKYSVEYNLHHTQSGAWLYYQVLFVVPASFITSVALVEIQKRLWEPIIGDKMLYRIKPHSKTYYAFFIVMIALCTTWYAIYASGYNDWLMITFHSRFTGAHF